MAITNHSVNNTNLDTPLAIACVLSYTQDVNLVNKHKLYNEICEKGFKFVASQSQADERAVAFVNDDLKTIIVAIRGTHADNVWDLLCDLGVVLATLEKSSAEEVFLLWLAAMLLGDDNRGSSAVKAILPFIQFAGGQIFYLLEKAISTLGNTTGVSAFLKDSKLPETLQILKQNNTELAKNAVLNKLKAEVEQADLFIGTFLEDQKYHNYRLIVTGHSLGGFFAQIIAAKKGLDAITFNAPGAKAWMDQYALKIHEKCSITNYVRTSDLAASLGTHIGKKMVWPAVTQKDLSPWEKALLNHSIAEVIEYLKIESKTGG